MIDHWTSGGGDYYDGAGPPPDDGAEYSDWPKMSKKHPVSEGPYEHTYLCNDKLYIEPLEGAHDYISSECQRLGNYELECQRCGTSLAYCTTHATIHCGCSGQETMDGHPLSAPVRMRYTRWRCYHASPIVWVWCSKCGDKVQLCQIHKRGHCGCRETDSIRLPR